MTDLSLLDSIPAPCFAFKTQGSSAVTILFWNEAMEEHCDVERSQAIQGKLPALVRRITSAHQRSATSANLGSMGTFDFKMMKDGIVIATFSARATLAFEEEKVIFLAMAAHDLRAPLRRIRLLLDEVRDGFVDMGDGKLELLNTIEDVGERARIFTNDVITYTRATQIPQLDTAEFDLEIFAQDIFDAANLDKTHSFRCTPSVIETDRLALQVALRNLIDNAVRHGGKERMRITVKVESVPSRRFLRLTVSDDGQGLDTPAAFFKTTAKNRNSSSFGLLGVRRLIEARGGAISAARPESGQGSAISFTLPGIMLSDMHPEAKAV